MSFFNRNLLCFFFQRKLVKMQEPELTSDSDNEDIKVNEKKVLIKFVNLYHHQGSSNTCIILEKYWFKN